MLTLSKNIGLLKSPGKHQTAPKYLALAAGLIIPAVLFLLPVSALALERMAPLDNTQRYFERVKREEQERLKKAQEEEQERLKKAQEEEQERLKKAQEEENLREMRKRIEFVKIPAGCFRMGSPSQEKDRSSDEGPVHEVCVDGFELGKYEVTQGQWNKVMGSNPSHFTACGDGCPVEGVSWEDVQVFLKRLNGGSGNRYRLPTEAEWEYACRGGRSGETYCGGNDVGRVAWYGDNSGETTHPVGQKAANGFGLYDMSGNVDEWVQDWYGDKYYANSPSHNPAGPSGGSYRVRRGGSWSYIPAYVRAACRHIKSPAGRLNFLGFRLLRTYP